MVYAWRGSLYKESRYAFGVILGRVELSAVISMARAKFSKIRSRK